MLSRFKKGVAATAGIGVFALVPLAADPAGAATFANATSISVPDPTPGSFDTPANPYPSAINVSGLSGSVSDVNLTICGFSATYPSDVNVLLVAPNGTNAVVMSDVGGNGDDLESDPERDVPVDDISLTLDDAAAAPLPADSALSSGTFRPVDDDTGELGLGGPGTDSDNFPPPAPAPSANVALSAFNGISPNGTWNLYMFDDYPATAGVGEVQKPVFSCGWSLDVTTGGGGGTTPTKISVFRPSSGTWLTQGGSAVAFGTAGDIPVPGDYDGNGTTDDIAVFRPSTGIWYHQSGAAVAFGTTGDIPVPADYDGNGTTDRAVFRPSTGIWYFQGLPAVAFGTSGDIGVPGDYDGNGTDEIAVFRPSNGTWYGQGGSAVAFGTSGDIPVPGDYDGNGTTDRAVFRPSTGIWYVHGGSAVQFGTSGDIPVPGDYDGNGTTDRAVFRPSTGIWYVHGGSAVQFGTSGDRPLPLPSAIRQVFFP